MNDHRIVSLELVLLNVSLLALRMNSGIGGVILLSTGLGLLLLLSSKLTVELDGYGLDEISTRCSSILLCLNAGLGARLTV
jgi:hypothetical protein